MIETRGEYRTAALAMVLAALLACKRGGSDGSESKDRKQSVAVAQPQGPDGPAPTARWDDYKLQLEGAKGSAMFFVTTRDEEAPLHIKAYFEKLAQGTTISVGKKTGTVGKNGRWSEQIDIGAQVGELPLQDATSKKVDLDLKVSIKVPGKKKLETDLPPLRMAEGLKNALKRARDGGLEFKGEPKANGKGKTAALLTTSLTAVGAGKKVQDIDWVVMDERDEKPSSSKTCKFNSGSAELLVYGSTVTVYDRRSGEQVAETHLDASSSCPSFAFVRDGKTTNSVAKKSIERWVRKQLASAK